MELRTLMRAHDERARGVINTGKLYLSEPHDRGPVGRALARAIPTVAQAV